MVTASVASSSLAASPGSASDQRECEATGGLSKDQSVSIYAPRPPIGLLHDLRTYGIDPPLTRSFLRILRKQYSGRPGVSKGTEHDRHGSEVCLEIPIAASPAIVFAFLTDSKRMSCWLAQDVIATPQPGGALRLWDPKGCWIEGTYLTAIPNRGVAFTWGGIDGLRIGQSIVTFTLELDGNDTVVVLRHSNLPNSAVSMHRMGWMQFGLPRLKAVAEGAPPMATYLGDIAKHREDTPYLSRFPCRKLESHSTHF